MKVLLTGGNGFLGSHVLEELLANGYRMRLLLRETSDTRHIRQHLGRVEVHYGELRDAPSLDGVVGGMEAVVHCAAKTRAVRRRDYYAVNARGTRNLVQACNARGRRLERFVLVSSLSVSGPGTMDRPAREGHRPRPVSHYGRSKMLAERWVRRRLRAPHAILRPAAIYGPRDVDFYTLFKMVRWGLMPLIDGGRQPISLVYVRDAARAVRRALECGAAPGNIYHVAHSEPCSQRQFLEHMAGVMGVDPLRLPVPHVALYPVCLFQEAGARLTGRASMMNLQKIPEYAAPGWVASTAAASEELDFVAGTDLAEGVRLTYEWYAEHGWL